MTKRGHQHNYPLGHLAIVQYKCSRVEYKYGTSASSLNVQVFK